MLPARNNRIFIAAKGLNSIFEKLLLYKRYNDVTNAHLLIQVALVGFLATGIATGQQDEWEDWDDTESFETVDIEEQDGAGMLRKNVDETGADLQAEPAVQDITRNVSQGKYIIKRWDTLWDLSHQFLADPFRWRDIWDINPHIANPDLIFPGDPLVLPGMQAAAEETSPESSKQQFSDKTEGLESEKADDNDAQKGIEENRQLRRTLISKGFFSPQHMAKAAFLWFDKDPKGKIYPGIGVVDMCKKTTVYRQFDEFPVSLYVGNNCVAGDTLDIMHSDRFVKFEQQTANLIRRTGRAVIQSIDGGVAVVRLIKAWDLIRCRDRVTKVNHSHYRSISDVADAGAALQGKVFQRIEQTESPFLFQSFLADVGDKDGVRMGDIFMVYPGKDEIVTEPSALACVVNVQHGSSTLSIVKMYQAHITDGDNLRLAKRVQFN
ncbi:MAG: LysM peptidoglycan-binding domain-containing protein [Chitinivibrionales bacterium]|nr:LysM peptidoglycan-binding domain-containing protein [Chitinivibrionales bacterium]